MFKVMHTGATLPYRSTPGSAGYELCAVAPGLIRGGEQLIVNTGVKLTQDASIYPVDKFIHILPKSGHALKGISVMAGVVDIDYPGEILVVLRNHSDSDFIFKAKQPIAQAVIQTMEIVRDETTAQWITRTNGFGSTHD